MFIFARIPIKTGWEWMSVHTSKPWTEIHYYHLYFKAPIIFPNTNTNPYAPQKTSNIRLLLAIREYTCFDHAVVLSIPSTNTYMAHILLIERFRPTTKRRKMPIRISFLNGVPMIKLHTRSSTHYIQNTHQNADTNDTPARALSLCPRDEFGSIHRAQTYIYRK